MRLWYKAPLLVLLVGSSIALYGARSAYLAQCDVVRQAEDRSLQSVERILRATIDKEAQRAVAFADVLSIRSVVANGLRSGDRATMLADLQPTWTRLSGSYGVDTVGFIAPPGVTFLRLHHPERFGDDVSGRAMIMTTLGRGEPQSGIEVGSSGAKIRGVARVVDAQGPAGVVEVGIPFAPVLDAVQRITNYELAAYLKQVGPPPADARMVDGYRELATTNRRAILGVTTAEDMDGIQSVRVERRDVHGRRFGVVRMPMVDFSGTNIGVMIATRDFRAYQRMETTALRSAITTALVQIVLLFGLVLITYNGFVLRPLRRLAEKLGAGESVDDYAERSDEVGDLARAVRKATEGRT